MMEKTVALEFTVATTKKVEVIPGTEVLNIDLKISYAEFLSMTKELEKPYKAKFELPDGAGHLTVSHTKHEMTLSGSAAGAAGSVTVKLQGGCGD